jgi:crotonobetaine/carnitine-CoA ligase
VTTFEGLDRESTLLAHGLWERGLRAGSRLVALLSNGPAFLPLMVAANKLGAVFVPINTELKGAFLEHQIRNSDPTVVAVDQELLGVLGELELRSVETLVVVGEREDGSDCPDDKVCSFSELAAGAPSREAELVDPAPSDTSTVIYTSGTTGPAKGVLMPNAHACLLAHNIVRRFAMTEDDVFYVCMPMFHTNALFMQGLATLMAGARAYVVRRFGARRWLHDVRSSGATLTSALGVMPEFIHRQPPTDHDADNRLRAMLAVPVGPWAEDLQRRFGVSLVQGYGMTEINMVAYTADEDPVEPGLCGRVLDEHFDVRVVDGEDAEVPVGEPGEIVVRPKVPWGFMAGYQSMPEQTVEAWQNLWFHTGDLGRFDGDKRLHFIDRTKDRIRRRGHNVSSYEIEQVVAAHPGVAECAAIAVRVADAGGEDEIKLCVVLHDGTELEPSVLFDFCRERMPAFALPRFIEYFDGLPTTATGKPRKELLRQRGLTPTTWDRDGLGTRRPTSVHSTGGAGPIG